MLLFKLLFEIKKGSEFAFTKPESKNTTVKKSIILFMILTLCLEKSTLGFIECQYLYL